MFALSSTNLRSVTVWVEVLMSAWRVLMVAVCLSGCGTAGDPDLVEHASGLRVELPRVTFNKWTDFLTLQAGLSDDCTFISPGVDDRSTVWSPLQVFWVIYDDVDDVKDGDSMHDVYYEGDELSVADFEAIDGKNALGFKFLPPSQRSLLSISNVQIGDDGRSIVADLGNPLSIRLHIDSEVVQGECDVQTAWCSLDEPCDEPEPLGSIFLELNGLNLVREMHLNPPDDG